MFVVTTDGFDIRSSVPVMHATYDLLNDVYETVLPDSPTDFLTWTPPSRRGTVQPNNRLFKLKLLHTPEPRLFRLKGDWT